MRLWNICWLVKMWLTWGRMEAKQRCTRKQEGFCQACTKLFAHLYFFSFCVWFQHVYSFFCRSEFDFIDFSISCDAEDLSWRRDVREVIVAGRWVSWLFWRLNTCVLWCQFIVNDNNDWGQVHCSADLTPSLGQLWWCWWWLWPLRALVQWWYRGWSEKKNIHLQMAKLSNRRRKAR